MSSESDEEQEEIRHFSHNHGLSLMTLSERRTDAVQCKLCNKDCDEGRIYVCKKRKCSWFALHQSCAMGVQVLRQELYNPLHPHPLALQYPKPGKHYFYCNACGSRHQLSLAAHSKIFRCDKCDFNLDDQCAYIRPAIEESRHRHHQYHQHPLLLLEKIPIDRIYCRLCATYISDPTSYGCLPCGFFLHRSCFERNLPQQIQHFYHPCPLILYTHPDDYSSPCRACDQFWPKKACLYYGCSRCRFAMDIDCALLPTKYTQSEQQIVFHFLHGHPLMSLAHEIKADHHDQVIIINKCYLCGKGCTDSTHAYACFYPSCKNKAVYIHKSCLEFPQQICHPFHPYHPLTLKPRENIIRCNACRELIRDENSYVCEFSNCSFGLHIECSRVIRPPINFEGHDHLLHFRDNVSTEDCSACNLPCESYGFSCPYCDFNLHLTCGPLPSSINHKCHVDPLILTNSPVEDNEDCEPEEFYCDACEEQRDPLLPFYYCAECRFVAEVKCVISKCLAKHVLMGIYVVLTVETVSHYLVLLRSRLDMTSNEKSSNSTSRFRLNGTANRKGINYVSHFRLNGTSNEKCNNSSFKEMFEHHLTVKNETTRECEV
ncbi:uncharacterized protein LOC132168386 [Corylus avellana]|uniref:uncharacterized protein LOC132168386 n=1 Tax=Corylus avellana TaxID=13451 RepID=UPI00286B657A|nr:uncharacterized protein LOC132168386 [Corylus avellana]